MDQKSNNQSAKGRGLSVGIAIGLAIGAGLGVAMDNIATGVALGLVIGVALGTSLDQKNKPSAPSDSDEPVRIQPPGSIPDTIIAANKRDLSISMLRANLIPLLFGIPIAIAQVYLFILLHGGIQVRAELPGLLLFVAVLLISFVAHELIHGLTWRLVGGKSPATITYGVQWRTLTPYAHVRGLMEVNAYRIGGLMPGLVLGISPYLLSLALGNTVLLCFGVIHTLAAGGDGLILWTLRKVKGGTMVEDHPSRAGCYVVEV